MTEGCSLLLLAEANQARGELVYLDSVDLGRHEPGGGPARKRCSPSWARLIAKVYQVDPLLCVRCGRRMSMVAFVTDAFAIRRILDHLGLSTPKRKAAAPPRGPPCRRAAGWGAPAE
jgi:hypothetical protein